MIPLHKPPELTGKYVPRVLKSRHLVTGPECERLRDAVAEYYVVAKDRVVLAHCATALFEAYMEATRRYDYVPRPDHCWPLFGEVAFLHEPAPGYPGEIPVLWTDIGGPQPDRAARDFDVVDCSHTAKPAFGAAFNLMSVSPIKVIPGPSAGIGIACNSVLGLEIQALVNYGFGKAATGKPKAWEDRLPAGRRWNLTDTEAALTLEAFELFPQYQEDLHVAVRKMQSTLRERLPADMVPLLGCPSTLAIVKPHNVSVKKARKELLKRGIQTGHSFPPAQHFHVPAWVGMSRSREWEVAKAVEEVLL